MPSVSPELLSQRPQRRDVSSDDDVVLLRQIATDVLFHRARCSVMDTLERVAADVVDCESFTGSDLTSKSAHARFSTLMAKHRKRQKQERVASGVEEEYTKCVQLLDNLAQRMDDHTEEQEAVAEQRRQKEKRQKEAAQAVRLYTISK